jgi:hypothetical protein
MINEEQEKSAAMGRGASPRGKSEGGDKLVVLPGLPVAQGSSVRYERASGALSVPAPPQVTNNVHNFDQSYLGQLFMSPNNAPSGTCYCFDSPYNYLTGV